MPVDVVCWANSSSDGPVERMVLKRRDPRPTDIVFTIEYSGICHSDSLTARSLWGPAKYPCCPGHELVGHVTFVGEEVQKRDSRFKVGSLVGVGCLVNSGCTKDPAEGPTCSECLENKSENFCLEGLHFTYQYPSVFPDDQAAHGYSLGGYSTFHTVDYRYAMLIPEELDTPELLPRVAPLLCAGVTVYTPMKLHKVGPGTKVGVCGFGGLGSMSVKIAKHLGAHVTVLTRSMSSKGELAKAMGADRVVDTTDPTAFATLRNEFDVLIDCISAKHNLNAYLSAVKPRGHLVSVGVPSEELGVHMFSLLSSKHLSSSPIGSIKDTQELIDLAGKNHSLPCDIEMITPDRINEAWDRMDKSDVKFRFVIDMRGQQ